MRYLVSVNKDNRINYEVEPINWQSDNMSTSLCLGINDCQTLSCYQIVRLVQPAVSLSALSDIASSRQFYGNLWGTFITYCLQNGFHTCKASAKMSCLSSRRILVCSYKALHVYKVNGNKIHENTCNEKLHNKWRHSCWIFWKLLVQCVQPIPYSVPQLISIAGNKRIAAPLK